MCRPCSPTNFLQPQHPDAEQGLNKHLLIHELEGKLLLALAEQHCREGVLKWILTDEQYLDGQSVEKNAFRVEAEERMIMLKGKK